MHDEARIFRALHEIAVASAGVLDLDVLTRLVVFHTRDLLGAEGAVLHTWDPSAELLRMAAGAGRRGGGIHSGPLQLGDGIAGRAALSRRLISVEDYAGWEHAVPGLADLGLAASIAVPLLVDDRLIGVLAAWFGTCRTFNGEHERLMALLAAQIAPALEAVRLHEVQARSFDRERALREVSRALASDLDEARVLELAVGHAARLLEAPYARVWLLDASGVFRCAAAEGFTYDGLIGESLTDDSVVGAALAAASLSLADAPANARWKDPSFGERTGLHAYLGVAIRRAGSPVGVIEVMRPHEEFAESDQLLLAGLADAVAVAVANARTLAAVADSEQRLRSLYEALACGILVTDVAGTIVHANSVAEDVFGHRLDAMRGRKSVDLWQVVGEDGIERSDAERRTFLAAAARSANRGFTSCIIRTDGERRWLQCDAIPIGDPSDQTLQVVTSFIDVTERKRAEAALAHQALHDALTGLPNRLMLHDRLEQAIAAGHQQGTPQSLLLMDLDRFKEINDTLGHHCGDALLRELGVRLKEAVRSATGRGHLAMADTVARLGGDEFAVLLPEAGADEAARVAERILDVLQEPFELEGQAFTVGGSIGIAVFPAHGDNAASLLRRADVAMYVAKRSDTGWSLYSFAHDQHRPDRLAMVGQLREAIERDDLVLHFQPKLDLRTGRVAGVEALVRWQHPTLGLILPDQFVPLAEQTGTIRALTRWVLEATLRAAPGWSVDGQPLPVAVNLSMRDLHDPQLGETIERLLKETGMSPSLLQVELTESTLMADPARAMGVLSRLRALGVTVAIDDFGTGYSSLALLKRLPVDALKIDRSFVRDVATSPSDRAIVRSTIELAHNLDLRVVAEGVEDEMTWRLLLALGCDEVQGYHLSRPLPAGELEAWLAEARPVLRAA